MIANLPQLPKTPTDLNPPRQGLCTPIGWHDARVAPSKPVQQQVHRTPATFHGDACRNSERAATLLDGQALLTRPGHRPTPMRSTMRSPAIQFVASAPQHNPQPYRVKLTYFDSLTLSAKNQGDRTCRCPPGVPLGRTPSPPGGACRPEPRLVTWEANHSRTPSEHSHASCFICSYAARKVNAHKFQIAIAFAASLPTHVDDGTPLAALNNYLARI